MKLFAVRRQGVKHNMVKLYCVIWVNCTHPLQTEVTSIQEYDTNKKTFNCL